MGIVRNLIEREQLSVCFWCLIHLTWHILAQIWFWKCISVMWQTHDALAEACVMDVSVYDVSVSVCVSLEHCCL